MDLQTSLMCFQGTNIPNTEADGEAAAFTDEELEAKKSY